MPIKYIVEDDYYILLDPDGNEIGRGSKKDKRYAEIEAHGVEGEYRIIQPEVKVGLVAGSTPITVTPPNEPPEWTGTPTPSFQQSAPGTHDLSESTFDPNGDTLIYTLGSASAALPTGVTLSSAGILTATSAVTSAITSAVIVNINDGTNSSVESTPFNISVFGGAAKRWNPGHYLKTQGFYEDSNQAVYVAGVNSKIDERIEDSALILGAHVIFAWGAINTADGVYDWTYLDQVLDNLASKTPQKRLCLKLNYKSAGSGYQELVAPADLEAAGYVKTNSNGAGSIAAIWETAVMDRYIATLNAIASRYNNNTLFESVGTSETAPSWANNPDPTFSWSAYITQLKRMYQECGAAFDKVVFMPGQNFAQSYIPELVEECYQQRIGTSEADIGTAESDEVFQGLAGAVRDYRGTIGRLNIASQPVLGGKDDIGPPSNVINVAQQIGSTHLSWVSDEPSPNSWSQILAAIVADPNLATTYPSRYPV